MLYLIMTWCVYLELIKVFYIYVYMLIKVKSVLSVHPYDIIMCLIVYCNIGDFKLD